MTLILEVPIASIAIVLTILSWRTLQAIKHLDVGKSFWVPVLTAGVFFFAGSILAILSDLGYTFLPYTTEIIASTRLLALCVLVSGVYMYSRKITKNLIEKLKIPTATGASVEEEPEVETESSTFVLERMVKKTPKKECGCRFNFGYLRTMPRDAALPEGCLSCNRVIECKHSGVKKIEKNQSNR